MIETGHISKSQYPGTKKNSICSKCGKSLNNKTRMQQDKHLEVHHLKEIENQKQTRLFPGDNS